MAVLAFKNALYASLSRSSPPGLVGVERQRTQDLDAIAFAQKTPGQYLFSANSELQLRSRQSVPREQAARGDRVPDGCTLRKVEDGDVLDLGQGVDHFNAQAGSSL
jgi:hypothetical protein